jgi:hypothetical protein
MNLRIRVSKDAPVNEFRKNESINPYKNVSQLTSIGSTLSNNQDCELHSPLTPKPVYITVYWTGKNWRHWSPLMEDLPKGVHVRRYISS